MSRSRAKSFKNDHQRAQPTRNKKQTSHQSASQTASSASPGSQKRKKAKVAAAAVAAASAKAVKPPVSKASKVPPGPPPKIPSYKVKLQELTEPIIDLGEYYAMYSFGRLWEDMTGQSILVQSNVNHHFKFTPAAAHALAYLLDVLERRKGWDGKSVSKLAKFPGGVADTTLVSLRNRVYSSKAYMDQATEKDWKFNWLIEYANHLNINPPPITGAYYTNEGTPANTAGDDELSSKIEEIKKILVLSGSLPNEVKTETLAIVLVQKYRITAAVLEDLSEPAPSTSTEKVGALSEDIVFYHLAHAMAKRRCRNKTNYGLEKLSVARNIATCLANGWLKY